MNGLLRLLIALALSFCVMMLGTFLSEQLYKEPNSKFIIGLTLLTGLLSYRYIKPKKQKDLNEVYWEHLDDSNRPIVQARGKILNQKREGEWDFFDEYGRYTETVTYENGQIKS
jgi:antitoxin component YwqK of YwqJK toxin-antitoxin module